MMIVSRINTEIICSYPETYNDNDQLGEILTSLLDDVVKATGVSWNEICTLNRKRRNVMARNLFCFVARKHLRMFTLQEIGDVFALRYCTVIHACHQIENALQLRDGESRKLQDQYLEILGVRSEELGVPKVLKVRST
jgi:chromosomal replication initiation ATPase DnaA